MENIVRVKLSKGSRIFPRSKFGYFDEHRDVWRMMQKGEAVEINLEEWAKVEDFKGKGKELLDRFLAVTGCLELVKVSKLRLGGGAVEKIKDVSVGESDKLE